MKRFLIFNFPAYEGTDLDYAIQGMTDRLDGINERLESLEDVMALDMRTGFMWQYYRDTTEWKCLSNISEYPDLDLPKPEKKRKVYRSYATEEQGGFMIPSHFRDLMYGSFVK